MMKSPKDRYSLQLKESKDQRRLNNYKRHLKDWDNYEKMVQIHFRKSNKWKDKMKNMNNKHDIFLGSRLDSLINNIEYLPEKTKIFSTDPSVKIMHRDESVVI